MTTKPDSDKWFPIPDKLPTEEGVYVVKTAGLFSAVGGTRGGEYIDTYSPDYGWGGFSGSRSESRTHWRYVNKDDLKERAQEFEIFNKETMRWIIAHTKTTESNG